MCGMVTLNWVSRGILVVVFLHTVAGQWMTSYDQHFKIECPDGQTIKSLDSHHDNHREDRVWNMQCADVPVGGSTSSCEWSNYVNDYDALFEYQCPGEKMICGIESIHDNHHEDRRYSFKCCSVPETIAHGCQFTSYVNDYDQNFNYRVPEGYILRGVDSVHNSHHEDRIFKFEICKLDPTGDVVVG